MPSYLDFVIFARFVLYFSRFMFCAFRLFYFMFFAVFVLYFSSDDKAAILTGAEIAFAADQYRVFRKSDILNCRIFPPAGIRSAFNPLSPQTGSFHHSFFLITIVEPLCVLSIIIRSVKQSAKSQSISSWVFICESGTLVPVPI